MKTIIGYSLILLLLALPVGVSADSGFLGKLLDRPFPKLKIPKVRVEVLDNGMRCFLLEDHTLPIVKIKIVTRVGNIYDPADKVGLATLVGMAMRNGGAGDMGPVEFDAAIDDLGATLSSDIGQDMGIAFLGVLSGDLEEGLSLFMDMVFKPRFDGDRLQVSRLQIEEALRRERDDPDTYASILYREFVYGKDNPWARRPDSRSLARIRPPDVSGFHKRYFVTNNMMLTAAGDFDSDELLGMIRELTREAPKAEIDFPKVPEIKLEFVPGERLVERPMTQSYIRLGHLGVKRHNPDWFPLFVMSHVFGANAFKSRLMTDIRTKRGLAYSISGSVTQGTDYGLFMVKLSTDARETGKVVDLVRGHIRRLAEEGDVTADEVEFARKSILSSAIFDIDTPDKVVSDRAKFFFYGYPDDYWRVAYDSVSSVNMDDVNRVAREYIHSDGLKVLILGPK